ELVHFGRIGDVVDIGLLDDRNELLQAWGQFLQLVAGDRQHARIVLIAKLTDGDGIDGLVPVVAVGELEGLAGYKTLVQPRAVIGDEVLAVAAVAFNEHFLRNAGFYKPEAERALNGRDVDHALTGFGKGFQVIDAMEAVRIGALVPPKTLWSLLQRCHDANGR